MENITKLIYLFMVRCEWKGILKNHIVILNNIDSAFFLSTFGYIERVYLQSQILLETRPNLIIILLYRLYFGCMM